MAQARRYGVHWKRKVKKCNIKKSNKCAIFEPSHDGKYKGLQISTVQVTNNSPFGHLP